MAKDDQEEASAPNEEVCHAEDLTKVPSVNLPQKGNIWLICGTGKIDELLDWLHARRVSCAPDTYRVLVSQLHKLDEGTRTELTQKCLEYDLNIEARNISLRIHAECMEKWGLAGQLSVLDTLDLTKGWRRSRAAPNEHLLKIELPAVYTRQQKEAFDSFISFLLNETDFIYRVS